MTGRATLTTVPSRNTMLDPSIVAARTHGPAFSAHGAEAAPERMLASSHGCLITAAIAHLAPNIPPNAVSTSRDSLLCRVGLTVYSCPRLHVHNVRCHSGGFSSTFAVCLV